MSAAGDGEQFDLALLAGLNYDRSLTAERSGNLPTQLPAVWMRLGDFDRAEQLAHTIPDPDPQAWALIDVTEALADAGEHDRAWAVAADTERVALTIDDPDSQGRLLTVLAVALARAGEHDRARAIAGDAQQSASAITDLPISHAWALIDVVRVLGEAGDRERVWAVAGDAERVSRTITHPGLRTHSHRSSRRRSLTSS